MELQEIISSVRGVYPSSTIQAGNNKWRSARYIITRFYWRDRRISWVQVGLGGETQEEAWSAAWEAITKEMLEKLEI